MADQKGRADVRIRGFHAGAAASARHVRSPDPEEPIVVDIDVTFTGVPLAGR